MAQEGGIKAGGDIKAGRDMAGRDIVQKEISMDNWFSRAQEMVSWHSELTDVERQEVLSEIDALKDETDRPKESWDFERMYEIVKKIASYIPVLAQVLCTVFQLPAILA